MATTPEAYELTVIDALKQIDAGSLSTEDWFASCLARIEAREPDVHAFASLNSKTMDEVAAVTKRGVTAIPTGAKDIIDVIGQPSMMGANFHDPAPKTREGGSVSLMREDGYVFVGKTVSTELGHRHPGPTRNPHNLEHTPGGSSSGSAAAVADKMIPVCLGTQTSGSVIRPAAYCGVVGYKPTYNDFDKTGILPNGPSMDTLGIMARCVDDVGLLRGTLLEEPITMVDDMDLSALRFGVLRADPWDQAEQETKDLIDGLATDLSGKGATLVEVDLDKEVPRLMALHDIISGYEFRRSIAFERLHHLEDLSAILREGRLATGHSVNNKQYQSGIVEVANLRTKVAGVFANVDILLHPSAAGPAPHGIHHTGTATFNGAWTLTGNPTITLPLFKASSTGLPIGCQLIAGFANDDKLLIASKAIMSAFG